MKNKILLRTAPSSTTGRMLLAQCMVLEAVIALAAAADILYFHLPDEAASNLRVGRDYDVLVQTGVGLLPAYYNEYCDDRRLSSCCSNEWKMKTKEKEKAARYKCNV